MWEIYWGAFEDVLYGDDRSSVHIAISEHVDNKDEFNPLRLRNYYGELTERLKVARC